jgi:hypothetical protein
VSRSVENQRARIVWLLMLSSLLQDVCLLFANLFGGLANLTNGVSSLWKGLAQGSINFSNTFLFLWKDQNEKYQALTGRSFGGMNTPADAEHEAEDYIPEDDD